MPHPSVSFPHSGKTGLVPDSAQRISSALGTSLIPQWLMLPILPWWHSLTSSLALLVTLVPMLTSVSTPLSALETIEAYSVTAVPFPLLVPAPHCSGLWTSWTSCSHPQDWPHCYPPKPRIPQSLSQDHTLPVLHHLR